ncbi:MAG: SDR family NAD(P)-dependent oxidoreductase [Bacteroidales bacterium]|jgi:short-subunit dehydrogenase
MENGYVIVTGATGGIGSEIVKGLILNNYNLIITYRNLEKATILKNNILKETNCNNDMLLLMELEMTSPESIFKFANLIKKSNLKIIGLINNAGVINRYFKKNEYGIESVLMVNYITPLILIKQLMPYMELNSKIVNVISVTSNKKIDKDLFNSTKESYSQLGDYSRTKAALAIYTSKLAETIGDKYLINMADPGVVNTNIITMHRWYDKLANFLFRPFIKKPKQGAKPIINAFLSNSGLCFFKKNSKKGYPKKFTNNPLKDWLWDQTNEIIHKIEQDFV